MAGARSARRVAAVFVLIGLSLGTATSARAQNAVGVIPVSARAHAASYGEWGARWWKWALEAPASENPLLDETGEHCDVNQTGNVWFLAGTLGSGSITRTCTVPTGVSLFFPVLNSAFIATEPFETEEYVHQQVTNNVDQFDTSLLAVEIDGVSVDDLGDYRAHSPTFDLVLPEGNIFGLPPMTLTPAAADGYWLMLRPLAPGEHTIRIQGTYANGTTLDVTYELVVAPPTP